jgi:hypothetical protein
MGAVVKEEQVAVLQEREAAVAEDEVVKDMIVVEGVMLGTELVEEMDGCRDGGGRSSELGGDGVGYDRGKGAGKEGVSGQGGDRREVLQEEVVVMAKVKKRWPC